MLYYPVKVTFNGNGKVFQSNLMSEYEVEDMSHSRVSEVGSSTEDTPLHRAFSMIIDMLKGRPQFQCVTGASTPASSMISVQLSI